MFGTRSTITLVHPLIYNPHTMHIPQIRLDLQGNAALAGVHQSSEVTAQYTLLQKCDYQTCNGCIDLNVQRLCYGAQQCTIARCIGTLTNQNRPMCGIGQTGQAVLTTMIVLINSAWNIFVETLTTILGLTLAPNDDPLSQSIRIKWIDDSFYSAVCSAKDASATFISILTSTINYVFQSISSKPVSYMDMAATKVDSNTNVMFTMAITSLNNFLNQIALGVFYPLFALQKSMVCSTNSVLAISDALGFSISIGIEAIQVRVMFSGRVCVQNQNQHADE
jgi:hypothetical protein